WEQLAQKTLAEAASTSSAHEQILPRAKHDSILCGGVLCLIGPLILPTKLCLRTRKGNWLATRLRRSRQVSACALSRSRCRVKWWLRGRHFRFRPSAPQRISTSTKTASPTLRSTTTVPLV